MRVVYMFNIGKCRNEDTAYVSHQNAFGWVFQLGYVVKCVLDEIYPMFRLLLLLAIWVAFPLDK